MTEQLSWRGENALPLLPCVLQRFQVEDRLKSLTPCLQNALLLIKSNPFDQLVRSHLFLLNQRSFKAYLLCFNSYFYDFLSWCYFLEVFVSKNFSIQGSVYSIFGEFSC